MIGHSVFTYQTSTTATNVAKYIEPLTPEQYQQWQQLYTMDALKNIRYGQSFCNHFGLEDNLLYYTTDTVWCDNYIRKTYIARH